MYSSFLVLSFNLSLTISINFFYLFLKSKDDFCCLFICLFVSIFEEEREWRCETWESDNGILRFLPSFSLFLFLSLAIWNVFITELLFVCKPFFFFISLLLSIYFSPFVSFQVWLLFYHLCWLIYHALKKIKLFILFNLCLYGLKIL